ncbi:uncharacterized protein LOC116850879 [Odontomachus brunneus]|uniref:uncharacterized protein LOC116850879 n=1 Tax=Odontomachus brunneus TaxID=486640 RepID=UPI0013F1C820|nr:uncharacterized protein LOC116850879 [Odontomachus brunneus]XP_032685576.1 uncharacterized protein LOC116850879 [Odontomachus brunneus]
MVGPSLSVSSESTNGLVTSEIETVFSGSPSYLCGGLRCQGDSKVNGFWPYDDKAILLLEAGCWCRRNIKTACPGNLAVVKKWHCREMEDTGSVEAGDAGPNTSAPEDCLKKWPRFLARNPKLKNSVFSILISG